MAEDPVRQQAQGLRARVGAGTHGVSKLWSRGGVGLRASSRSTQTPNHGGRTVKTSVGRLLTGVVALALLLGGFGLMQDSAQAQAGGAGHDHGDADSTSAPGDVRTRTPTCMPSTIA